MLGDGPAFAKQNNRGKNEVDANVYHNGQPNYDAICFREVKHQNIRANAELDQSHAVEIEELPEPEPSEVLLHMIWSHDGIPNVSTSSHLSCFVSKDGTDDGK